MTAEVFDQEASLLKNVRERLNAGRDRDLMVIWKETSIPYYWLRKIASGDIKNPSVNRIQFLHEYFTKKKLEV